MHGSECQGKKKYRSYWEAARAVKSLNRFAKAHANQYRCLGCHLWHVGNNNTNKLNHHSRRIDKQRLRRSLEHGKRK